MPILVAARHRIAPLCGLTLLSALVLPMTCIPVSPAQNVTMRWA